MAPTIARCSTTALPDREYRPLRSTSGMHLQRCRCQAGVHEPVRDEQHQAYSVTMVERGTLGYRTRSGGALLRPGWLMLGNAGEGYACSHAESDGHGDDCVLLSLSPQVMSAAGDALAMPRLRHRFERAALPPMPRVAALVTALLADGAEGFALEETALAVVAQVQCALHAGAAPAPVARQDERALIAAHCIDQRAGEPLKLDDVAAAAGLGSFHLVRVFRRSIGVTPHQYLMRVRLLRAMRLLRDTARPITDVAYEAGWSDLSNFTRTFRRDVGCTPGNFRRGHIATR